MGPAIVFTDQIGLDRVVSYVRDDSIVLLVRPRPVVEPLALPELPGADGQDLGGLMAGPALEVLDRALKAVTSQFEE